MQAGYLLRMVNTRSWPSIATAAFTLAADASTVVALRMAKLSAGDADALTEAQLMVGEKFEAALEFQMLAWTGGLGTSYPEAAAKSLQHFGKAVRANRRRLSAR